MVGDRLAAGKLSVLGEVDGLWRPYWAMPNRRQPSRLVVLRRSSMWKKGTGEEESATGGPPGIFATTASTVHGAFAPVALRIPGSVSSQLWCPAGIGVRSRPAV